MAMTIDKRGTPSPLPYYLSAAAAAHAQAIAAAGPHPSKIDVAIASAHRLTTMMDGIEKWQATTYRRPVRTREVLWQMGPARLLDIGGDGPLALVVPSLINRSYILDLSDTCSFVDRLRDGGLHPVLLDWGDPDATVADFDLADYVSQVLIPAVHFLAGRAAGRISLIGYCMGGTLSAALAAQAAPVIRNLALLGTPWNFGHLTGVAAQLQSQFALNGAAALRAGLRQTGQTYGAVPGDLFQYLFAALAPMQAIEKFTRFAQMDPASSAHDHFCAVETWVNDSVAIPAAAAETLLADWYCQNSTMTGGWSVNGRPVRLDDINCPVLTICGANDHIVPQGQSPKMAAYGSDNADHIVQAGHVGMIAGRLHAQIAYRVCQFLV